METVYFFSDETGQHSAGRYFFIKYFGGGRHSIVRHQGLNYKSRQKLKADLTAIGSSYEIQPGSQEKRAEVRLADALCGYLGMKQFNDAAKTARYFPDVPSWFIDLKSEAPL